MAEERVSQESQSDLFHHQMICRDDHCHSYTNNDNRNGISVLSVKENVMLKGCYVFELYEL